MPGYKIHLQKSSEIREGIKCTYCRLVLRDPIQTRETGQRYCRECFTDAIRSVLIIVHMYVHYMFNKFTT